MSLRKLLTLFIVLMALGTTSSPGLLYASLIANGDAGHGGGQGGGAPGSAGGLGDPYPRLDDERSRRGKLSLYFRHQPLCGEDRVAGGPRTLEIKSTPPTCRESACVSAAAAQR